jgi:hypothetical protein
MDCKRKLPPKVYEDIVLRISLNQEKAALNEDVNN